RLLARQPAQRRTAAQATAVFERMERDPEPLAVASGEALEKRLHGAEDVVADAITDERGRRRGERAPLARPEGARDPLHARKVVRNGLGGQTAPAVPGRAGTAGLEACARHGQRSGSSAPGA